MFERVKSFLRRKKYQKQLTSLVNNYLFFLEHADKTVWGSITQEDEKGIARAVDVAKQFHGSFVEIGALFGHTTQLLATLKEVTRPLIAVENFSWNPFGIDAQSHRLITQRTLRYCMENCAVCIFDGSNASFYASQQEGTIALIFIDAGHSYEEVKYDLEQAKKLKIPVICGHDYIDLHPGVVKAVNESFGTKIEVIGSVWIATTGDSTDEQ